MFFHTWHKKGIYKIKHLLDNTSNFCTFEKFSGKSTIKTYFTTYYGLLNAIRRKWRTVLDTDENSTQNWYDDKRKLITTHIHQTIVNSKFSPTTTEQKNIKKRCTRKLSSQCLYTRSPFAQQKK